MSSLGYIWAQVDVRASEMPTHPKMPAQPSPRSCSVKLEVLTCAICDSLVVETANGSQTWHHDCGCPFSVLASKFRGV